MKKALKYISYAVVAAMLLSIAGCSSQGQSDGLPIDSDISSLKVTITNSPPPCLYTFEKDMPFYETKFGRLNLWTEASPSLYTTKNGVTRTCIMNDKTIAFDIIPGKTPLDENYFDMSTGKLASWASNVSYDENRYLLPDEIDKIDMWRAYYYGVFSVWSDDTTTYTLLHGENKNATISENGVTYYYNNTVMPADRTYTEAEYGDVWSYYFGFVCSASGSNEEVEETGNLMINDYGPIVWPDNGYLDRITNNSISSGPRHPCALVYGDYIYVFYLETYDIKVIRAPLSGGAKPGTFMKYYQGAWDQNALPENFNKDDHDMVYQISGQSSAIVPRSGACVQFAVAHVKDTEYFVGILEENDNKLGHVTKICVSKDLVNWTTPQVIPGTEGRQLWYTKIFNRDLSSSFEVDADGFFITGTGTESEGAWPLPQYYKLSINITEE